MSSSAPGRGVPSAESTRPRTTHGVPVPMKSMDSPSSRRGDSIMWNGPSTVDSVAVPFWGDRPPSPPRSDTLLLIVSTSMEMPSTSESRINSCRSSSHFRPVAVRNSIARSHSAMVGSVSLTNACRCLTRLLSSSRSRGSWVLAKLSTTASVAVSSVKSVAMADSVSLAPPVVLTQGATPGRPPQGHIGDRAQVAQLVGVDHGSDRLHLAVGDVESEDVDDAPRGVVGDRPGLAVDPGQLDAGAHLRPPASQPEHEPGHLLRPVERPGRRPGLA